MSQLKLNKGCIKP